MNEKLGVEASPNGDSQQIVSDDDEIDYSSKPEFYDPKLDEKEELWAQKQRGGRTSDAVLSCPACFTTLCLDCQRIIAFFNRSSESSLCGAELPNSMGDECRRLGFEYLFTVET